MPRFIRDEDRTAYAIDRTRRGLADVQRPTGTERRRTSEVAESAAVDSEFAKQLAEQLEGELAPLPGQIQSALDDAAEALSEAGLARSDAADAVSAAQDAVADASQAIADALAAANAAGAAQSTANAAQSAANAAQDAADQAAADALAASNAAAAAEGVANSKGKVIIQSGAPAVADRLPQNLWIDTTGGANTPKRWNGSAWVAVTDKAATDAAAAAVSAQDRADEAFDEATAAATAAGTALTAANGKNRVWYQGTAPAGTGHKIDDVWFNTAQGNRMARWTGSAWDVVEFGGAALANLAVTNAKIADATIQNAKIANLDAGKITTGTLDAARIAALSISTGKLAAESVTAEKIAALAVTASHIAANAVTAVAIAADAVTAEKIAAGAVATDKLDALAVTAEKIAAGAIITEKLAAEAVTAEHIAANALDAMMITGAQIYGGYIEAPMIASSDKLGSGANVLNDPGVTSTVNTAWVMSGHTGDTTSKTQQDTITWDQTWQQAGWEYPTGTVQHGVRNWGNVVAVATIAPNNARDTGTLAMPNISWVNTTSRTFTNPYTFVNKDWLQILPYQSGGTLDPTFKATHGAPASITGTARTTYLTNSATIAVVAGERWNVRAGFTRLASASLPFISGAWVEIINASTSAVLWSRQLTSEELSAGQVNAWWDSAFTGNVKYRVKLTYTAGGKANYVRRPQAGSFARRYTKGVIVDEWITTATGALQYQSAPTMVAAGSYQALPAHWQSRVFDFKLTSALFAKVTPEKGWRLTKENGLELFNSLGAKTGQLDGQNNFLAGRFGTAESGVRWEMNGDQLNLYNAAGSLINSIRRDGTSANMQGSFTLNGKPLTSEESLTLSMLTLRSGYTLQAGSWVQKRSDGFVRGVVIVKRTSGAISGDTNGANLVTLPVGWRPDGVWEGACATSQGGDAAINFGQITSGGAMRCWNATVGNQQAAWQFEFKIP